MKRFRLCWLRESGVAPDRFAGRMNTFCETSRYVPNVVAGSGAVAIDTATAAMRVMPETG